MSSEEFMREFPEHAGALKKVNRDQVQAPAAAKTPGSSRAGGSKFRNEKAVIDGISFDSKREAKRYQVLKVWQETGQISKLELQVPHRVVIKGVEVFEY